MAQIRSTAYYGFELYGANLAWRRTRRNRILSTSIFVHVDLLKAETRSLHRRSKSYELACDMQTGARGQKYPPAKLMFTLSDSQQA